MILRNFVDERGLLHCYRKESDRTFDASPENVFVRQRLYSKHGDDGLKTDASKEQELGVQIEGPAQPVVEKIVASARARQLPELTREEKYAWDMFFCVQARRTAAARADLDDSDLMQGAIDAAEKRAGPLSPEERAEIDGTPDRRRTAIDEAWIDTITEPMGDLFDALRLKGLLILMIENPKKAYVIGDVPILPMIPLGATLHHRDAADLFPVARDVAVACSGSYRDEELCLVPKGNQGTRLLRTINLAILEQSSMVACPTSRLIESLRRGRR